MKITIIPDDRIVVDLGNGDGATWRIGPDVPKPHIHPLTLSGYPLTLASPFDHVHHRGAMFAMRVDDINYWEETDGPQCGVQRVRDIHDFSCDLSHVSFTLEIDWVPNGARDAQLKEYRSFSIRRPRVGGVMIGWRSTLFVASHGDANEAEKASVVLSGDTPHSEISYYGLGIRFQRSMDIGGNHQNSEGARGVEGTHGHRAAWHHYGGRLDESGTQVGIAIFDHPENPRHPSPWFSMQEPFAYVSASLVATQRMTLARDEPLSLSYGIWAHPGDAQKEDVDVAYREWLGTKQ